MYTMYSCYSPDSGSKFEHPHLPHESVISTHTVEGMEVCMYSTYSEELIAYCMFGNCKADIVHTAVCYQLLCIRQPMYVHIYTVQY